DFEVDCKFSNRNFLGVTGSWRGLSSNIGLLNVYAPQSSSLKEQLWSSIKRVISDMGVTWIVFCDFNVVRSLDERMGSSFDVKEANTFNDFISRSGLPNFGPKPFRIFDTWIGIKGFHDLILDSWATGLATRPSSNPHIALIDKLKKLRMDIKAWTSARINHDIAKREEWLMDLDHLDQIQRDDLKQKSIMVNGIWQEDHEVIIAATFDHFSSRFKESRSSRPCFLSSRFRKISDQDACFLESTMSLEEIKEAVEFLECIRFLETSGRFANGCSPSFIVLIPKRKDPFGFRYYRPISLIGCVYKIISKILANRLAKVIDTVISQNQAAFISGRQILDGVLVANEIIRMATIE
nr:hypothetical protein [Tanacetum cinerariifolium]